MTETKKPVSVLKNATAHYKSQISGSLKNFEVPEWDCTIYYRPIQSLRAESEVVELTKAGKSTEALVMSIINKARDEEGNLMFTKHDKNTFMHEVDPTVIIKVASRINGGDLPEVGEIEKN